MILDAHQHVWDLERADYTWLGEEHGPINRTIALQEVLPEFDRVGVDASILVQAADDDRDTEAMLEVASAEPRVVGVVGYVPLERPDEAAERLAILRQHPKLVGIRNLIHDRTDPDFLLRPDVDEGLGVLEAAGVPFDLVSVLPRHLAHVPVIGERHPGLRIVIDHLSKPPFEAGRNSTWWGLIAQAAENPRVYGKVSGLYPSGEPGAAVETIRPFVEHAAEVFGAERLMYGGDWPMSELEGGYEATWATLDAVFGTWDGRARRRVLAETAIEFYGISASVIDKVG